MPNHAEPTTNGPTSASRNPSGRRARGPEHFASETAAAEFPGLPEGESHTEIKDLLEALGPRSGLSRPLIRHLVMLLEWTRPQDWTTGAQPIVWLSVGETARALGISASQVSRNEKALHGLGALSWKDSANHRRYGARDATGAIVEAWGVNLAPAAALLPELRRLARDHDDDRARWKFLRQRIAARRANILGAVGTAIAAGALTDHEARAWRNLVAEAVGRIGPHTPHAALERRLRELDHLDAALQDELAGDAAPDPAEPVDNSSISGEMLARGVADASQGSHGRKPPLDYTTNESGHFNDYSSAAAGREGERVAEADAARLLDDAPTDVPVHAFLTVLPPILRLRLPHPAFGWPELIEAAFHASGELGISRHAWNEACTELGPERAAVVLTIVALKKEQGLIRKSAGAYFRGMTRKHAAGELHLRNSIFGLRQKEHGGRGGGDTAGPGRAR